MTKTPRAAGPIAVPLYVGNWIDALESLGYTRNSIARAIGVTQSYISNMSHGTRPKNPKPYYLLRISQILGVTINDFFVCPPDSIDPAEMTEVSRQAVAVLIAAHAARGPRPPTPPPRRGRKLRNVKQD